MRVLEHIKPGGMLLIAILLTGFTTACVDEAKLNTDQVNYTPEDRPLGVIAPESAQYELGSSTTVTLAGRLVGTVDGQSVLWTQTEGTPVEGVTDWSAEQLTFPMPAVEGIESFDFEIAVLQADGSQAVDADGEPLVASTSITVYDPDVLIVHEIEDSSVAELISVGTISEGDDGYLTGAVGPHTADIVPGASVKFTLNMEQDSFFSLLARFGIPSAGYGSKNAIVTVNGVDTEIVINATGSFADYPVGTIKLTAGENVIEIGGGWNYYRLDSIKMVPAAEPPAPLPVAAALVNPNAQDSAVSLMEYLAASYGSLTLSGQTEYPNKIDGTFPLTEFDKVVAATGDDAPAIVGFDFIDFSASRVANGSDSTGLSEAMIAEHNDKNVILSGLWHWNAPMHLLDADGDGVGDESGSDEQAWWAGFYSRATSFDLAAALADTSSPEYQALIDDIDTVSAELKKFADADIPILWRPLHEAQGEWFWWGAAGPEALKQLWVLMYERMTETHGLNNLIWVFTYAGDLDANWYPGDDYVDIVGYDGYDANNADNPFKGQYATLKNRHNGDKIIALTETGTVPNVELMHQQNAWWSFFITWNSGGDYGPDGIDNAIIDTNYAYDGVANLADIPGGRSKVEAGLYAGFEPTTFEWGAQVNWTNTDGLTTSQNWAASGTTALSITKDMTAVDTPENVVFQSYPVGGIDVSGMDTLTIKANVLNAGLNVTAHIFFKAPDGVESWPAGVAVSEGGVELSIDVSEVDTLNGLGVRFEGLDPTATAAQYLIDAVSVEDDIIYDFEPDTSNWETQIAWSATPGITTSTEWSNSGARSLALYKDLTAEDAASDIVFQVYPEGGIDVTDKSTLTINANAIGAGSTVDAHIFFKAPDGVESWPAAVAVTDGGVALTIDVSEVSTLNGIGVRFNSVDAASDNARFFIDSVQIDGSTLYDFEGAGNWEFQVNWSPASGVQLSNDWAAQGSSSVAGVTQLVAGDDNIILQTYPAGGLLLGDVSTLKLTAYAMNAGDDVTAQLWAKDKEGTWRDEGEFAVGDNGVELSVDVSDLSELQGFGVRFQHAVNSESESSYYIDNVAFE